jgi:Tfp pilus assembly protein PilF
MIWSLGAFWLLAGCGYIAAALRQKERLNLSATAGGQMPYLVYAQHAAGDGLFGHFGDRNRMPLVPVLLSLVHDSNWEQFVNRASWLVIALSGVFLSALALIAYRNLSPLFATAFTLIVATTVFAPQASFVGADPAYYALFFCSWWTMSRLVERPTTFRAITLGLLLGLTYLTKASILLAVPILLGVLVLRIVLVRRTETGRAAHAAATPSNQVPRVGSAGRTASAAAVTLIVFLTTVFPYLHNNHERFGRYFYNVNTTFFVWCDSWAQAQRFAEKYSIDRQFPNAPPESIPGPRNYWRTHSWEQVGRRLVYGLQTLGRLAAESASLKYLLVLAACAGVLSIINPSHAGRMIKDHRWALAFSILLFCAYLIAYAWYVVVAYGDRFILSLVPPALFAFCAYVDRMARAMPSLPPPRTEHSVRSVLSVLLILLALGEAIASAGSTWITPSATFLRFYYDESHDELRRGNLEEALRGMHGVLTLDPGFAAAHRDLGMIALAQGRYADAIPSLLKAVSLEPERADVQNSLGSALLQAGRLSEAIPILERATALDPDLAPAWYNLCGALFQHGEREKARVCALRLEQVSPELARNLRAVFDPLPPQPP